MYEKNVLKIVMPYLVLNFTGSHNYLSKRFCIVVCDKCTFFFSLQGMYGHVAVYDIATKKIYIHGGMTLSNDKIQASNRMFVFDPFNIKWNILDKMLNEVVIK